MFSFFKKVLSVQENQEQALIKELEYQKALKLEAEAEIAEAMKKIATEEEHLKKLVALGKDLLKTNIAAKEAREEAEKLKSQYKDLVSQVLSSKIEVEKLKKEREEIKIAAVAADYDRLNFLAECEETYFSKLANANLEELEKAYEVFKENTK
jgi:hypothetical protein